MKGRRNNKKTTPSRGRSSASKRAGSYRTNRSGASVTEMTGARLDCSMDPKASTPEGVEGASNTPIGDCETYVILLRIEMAEDSGPPPQHTWNAQLLWDLTRQPLEQLPVPSEVVAISNSEAMYFFGTNREGLDRDQAGEVAYVLKDMD